jgi:hypothetical protein
VSSHGYRDCGWKTGRPEQDWIAIGSTPASSIATACPPVELIDRASWETLRRPAQAGILQLASTPVRIVYRADAAASASADAALEAEPAARAA